MDFNKHFLKNEHAFLGASKYHWINYDSEKLARAYEKWRAAERGTELHAFAAKAINLGIKLNDSKRTINLYVNDAIGYRMSTEVILYYSENCYGTADAISFEHNLLRIHDLKSGDSPASVHQLEIYMALFCLEYKQDPYKIKAELRIYQSNGVSIFTPDPAQIKSIMDKIVVFDLQIEKMKNGGWICSQPNLATSESNTVPEDIHTEAEKTRTNTTTVSRRKSTNSKRRA